MYKQLIGITPKFRTKSFDYRNYLSSLNNLTHRHHYNLYTRTEEMVENLSSSLFSRIFCFVFLTENKYNTKIEMVKHRKKKVANHENQ